MPLRERPKCVQNGKLPGSKQKSDAQRCSHKQLQLSQKEPQSQGGSPLDGLPMLSWAELSELDECFPFHRTFSLRKSIWAKQMRRLYI